MTTNNNVQNVKFLRNGSVFTPSADPVKTARELALAAMNGQLNSLADGTAILGRYQETNGIVKTLVGFAYVSGETRTLTVLDVDGAGADVDAKILAAIQALDAEKTSTDGKNVQVKVTEVDGKITAVNITTDNTVNSGDVNTAITTAINNLDYTGVTTGEGVYVTNVTEADGVIAATTATLPTVAAISETGKAIIAVAEDKGTVSATAGTINAEYVNVSYSAITATNVKGALAEIADEINAMDKSASAVDGQVVTTVSEVDGVVSETKANVKDLQLGGYSKSSSTGAIASTDTINEALSKLENKAAAITIGNSDHSINVTTGTSGTDIAVNIKNGEKVIKLGNDGIYTDIKIASATPSSTTVKEEYNLLDSDGNALGTSIKIYKDSHIVSITYITDSTSLHYQNLEYKYIDADGAEQTEYVDISSLVLEAEFASGITVTDNVAHGVVDSTSESFLTVGAGGFKLSGVQDAIDTAISGLDASVSAETTSKHVSVKIDEVDGKLTAVTLTDNDIASQAKLDELSGKSVTAVAMTGGTVDVVDNSTDGTKKITINTDGSSIKMTGYAKGSASGAVDATDSVNAAIGKLENQIAGKVDALDATVSGETSDSKVKVQVVQENGVLTAVTVTGTNIASASDLTNEIAHRKDVDGVNGDAYIADTTAHYISAATSLFSADKALDTALKTADDAMLTGVTAGYGISVSNKSDKSQTISAKVKNDGGLVVDSDGLHLGYIDAGMYDAN